MEKTIAHLGMIQDVISRMSGNSLKMKEWCIAASSAVVGLSFTTKNIETLSIVYAIVLLFWSLDAYYLRLEKGFRVIYNIARQKTENDIDFDMTPNLGLGICDPMWRKLWRESVLSPATAMIYIAIAAATLIAWSCLSHITQNGGP